MAKKADMTFDERRAYVEAYTKARKTKKGSPKALYGGKYAEAEANKAVTATRNKTKGLSRLSDDEFMKKTR